MAIKKLKGGKGRKKVAVKKRVEGVSKILSLPTKKKRVSKDLSTYTGLLYGREKIGKTLSMSGFPGAIFFATEPGHEGLSIFSFNDADGGVTDWEVFRQGVDLLENTSHDFKTVIIDTADRAYDICLDWVCEVRGIEYPGVDDEGENDFGKSWRAVRQEFSNAIYRLKQAGLSVWFVSHAKEQTFRPKSGEKYTRIFPSMSNQARGVVEALVDMFFYCEYLKDTHGKTHRVLICEGDESIWAGVRAIGDVEFPVLLPLQKEHTFGIIDAAFKGEGGGLDIEQFYPSKLSTKTGEAFIKKYKAKAIAGKKKGGKKIRRIS